MFKRGKNLLSGLILLGLIGGVGQLLALRGWFASLDEFYFDLWHQMAGQKYRPRHVVIVSVGDATLEAHPHEPLVTWSPYWARAVQVLRTHGARAIGLDYLFSVSIESWLRKIPLPAPEAILAFDRPFKEQLATGEVVVAGRIREIEGTRQVVPPVEDFAAALPSLPRTLGLIDLITDADGAVRCFAPALEDGNGAVFLTFPYLLAVRYQGRDPVAELEELRRHPHLKVWSGLTDEKNNGEAFPRISFAGPPRQPEAPAVHGGPFPRLPFERLLAPGAEADATLRQAVSGKVVIVAYEPSGSQDMHPTPYALGFWRWPGLLMSGAEIHANVVETILSGRSLRPVAWWIPGVLGFLLLAAGIFLFFRLAIWRTLIAFLLLALLPGVLSYLFFRFDLLLPVAFLHGGLMVAYLGTLAVRLTGEERERLRLKRIFGRCVSEEVVEKLLAAETKPALGGEACEITVLFSDIRNFTTLSERLQPAQVVELLNEYFSRAIEPILAAGGTVDKFVGDAIMAVFGAPVPHPDHARRAVRAALQLVAVGRDFQNWMERRFPGLDLPPFRIGVGLHTGEAVVGTIGSPKRLEYTAIGDTVNTASRLEGLSKELGWQIVASRATLKAAGNGLRLGETRTLAVKGRQEPVEVAEILGLAEGQSN